MAQQVQFRRGTTAEHATFTGAVGEITVDTDKDVPVVHDGATAGGVPVAAPSKQADWTQSQISSIVTLTDAANIAITLSDGHHFKVTLGGNRVLDNPTGKPAAGKSQTFIIEFIQDATGGRVPTFGTDYIQKDGTAPVALASTAANKRGVYCGQVLDNGKILMSVIGDGI